jgi:hypothetical protein
MCVYMYIYILRIPFFMKEIYFKGTVYLKRIP